MAAAADVEVCAVSVIADPLVNFLAGSCCLQMGWGSNDKGQLGVPAGLYKQVHTPMRVHGFDGQRLVCISAGAKHSAAVQEGGVVVTWGHGRWVLAGKRLTCNQPREHDSHTQLAIRL